MSADSNSTPKIRAVNLHKRFGPKVVLDGLDLDVGVGESVVVIGGSGTGKSVLLKSILGLMEPEEGDIEIDGQSVIGLSTSEREKINRKFGMLFQGGALFDSLKVWENVAFGLIQGGRTNRAEARDIAYAKLADVGLSADVGELGPSELSGGMQKRVGIARAVITEPEFLFLDEPTAGLDPIMTNVIGQLITESVRKLGATAISITSDMTGARQIADRIAMLHEGRIIWIGSKASADESDNPYVDQLIHSRAQGPIEMRVTQS